MQRNDLSTGYVSWVIRKRMILEGEEEIRQMLASIAGKWQKCSSKGTPVYLPGSAHNAEGTKVTPVISNTYHLLLHSRICSSSLFGAVGKISWCELLKTGS